MLDLAARERDVELDRGLHHAPRARSRRLEGVAPAAADPRCQPLRKIGRHDERPSVGRATPRDHLAPADAAEPAEERDGAGDDEVRGALERVAALDALELLAGREHPALAREARGELGVEEGALDLGEGARELVVEREIHGGGRRP